MSKSKEEEKKKEGTILEIRVIPNAKKEKVVKEENILKVYVKSPPIKNKANKEVLKILMHIFNCNVELISGEKSRNKKVKLYLSKDEINKHLTA